MFGPKNQQEVLEAIIGMLRQIAPSSVSDEQVAKDFGLAVEQEQRLGDIYENLLDPKRVEQCRSWAFVLIRMNEQGQEERTVFPTPKRLEEAADLNDVLVWTACLGALVSPTVRAALVTHGYRFTWANAKAKPKPPPKPLIIT